MFAWCARPQAERGAADGGVWAAPGASGGRNLPPARAGRRLAQGGPRPARTARPAAGLAARRPPQPRRNAILYNVLEWNNCRHHIK